MEQIQEKRKPGRPPSPNGPTPDSVRVARYRNRQLKERGKKEIRLFVDENGFNKGYDSFDPNVEMSVECLAEGVDERGFFLGWYRARDDWARDRKGYKKKVKNEN